MDNVAAENNAFDDASGGAIAISCGAGVIRRCQFYGNSAEHGGGAIYGTLLDNTYIEDCYFEGNLADEGGAIYIEGRSDEFGNPTEYRRARLTGNVFTLNQASGSEGEGGGREAAIFLLLGPDATNDLSCLSFDNSVGQNPDVRGISMVRANSGRQLALSCSNEIIFTGTSVANVSILRVPSTGPNQPQLTISFSDTEEGVNSGVNGNIDLDPLFSTFPFLAANSPCIDQGDDNAWDVSIDPAIVDADFFGSTRIQGNAIDMGCVED